MKDAFYIHGSSAEEQKRLGMLNAILNERCLQQLQIREGIKILDVGSGTGIFASELAKKTGESGMVLGIERDTAQINTANLLGSSFTNLSFRQGDVYNMPLNNGELGSFDLVFSRFLLEHLPNPGLAIQEMLKALKPGGRIVLTDDDHATFMPTPEPAGFSTIWHAYLRSYDRLGNDPFVGRKLVGLLHQTGQVTAIDNTLVFFGGNAYQPIFPFVADNLEGILFSAKNLIVEQGLMDTESFDRSMDGIRHWKTLPDAALWYGICWVEGTKILI